MSTETTSRFAGAPGAAVPARSLIHAPILAESATISGRPLRVGLDLDGVCYDFVASVRRYLLTLGWDAAQLPDATDWEFFRTWGLSVEEFLQICHDGVNAGIIFATGEAYAGVAAAIARVHDAGHEVHVVTDRTFGDGDASKVATELWLPQAGIRYTSLTISADKTSVPCDTFIEDRDKNFLALVEAGVDAYLIDRPWNAHVVTDRRVSSVDEYVDLCLAKVAA